MSRAEEIGDKAVVELLLKYGAQQNFEVGSDVGSEEVEVGSEKMEVDSEEVKVDSEKVEEIGDKAVVELLFKYGAQPDFEVGSDVGSEDGSEEASR